jgi:succinyl-CoA synthetase beta subunit
MNIHEYQAKELLAKFGVPVPAGFAAMSPGEAVAAAKQLPGPLWVVKAQIHAGGRGKGKFKELGPDAKGGVRLARSVEEVRAAAEEMLGKTLVTIQTGPEGKQVQRLYITDGVDIAQEFYLALLVDRKTGRIAFVASTEGGMDIEQVAHDTPEKIIKVFIDPLTGLSDAQAGELAAGIGIPVASQAQAVTLFKNLYRCYMETDASLAEINPMILEGNGNIKALDAKFNFDANALFRHPEIVAYRDLDEEDPAEVEASKFDLSYISLDGNIGCLVNGAGLAMATMDTIKLFGGEPANFLDVGGGATAERVTEAFKIMLRNRNVKGILVNIFGGIMRCDTIAEGVIAACKAVNLTVPLVVRMKGTNEDLGKKLLAQSGLPIISADTMADAATKIVAAVR